ncbi:MAG: heparinase II/III family protein [Pseudomonadota bacterium]
MSHPGSIAERKARFLNRWHARRVTRSAVETGFVAPPEPRTIGSFGRGRQLVAGKFQFAGFLVEAEGVSPWDITPPDREFLAQLHGFAWLDDLAAVGDLASQNAARSWVWDWLRRYGNGRGPGWVPHLTGRRLIRWINHEQLLTRGQDQQQVDTFFRSIGQQTQFLSRRWHAALPGPERFEALCGLVYACLSLKELDEIALPASKALDRECAGQIDDQGGIQTRNPEELLDVFTQLTWAAASITDAGRSVPSQHLEAIERIAPTLRTLRHADGGLARFHGGGRGAEGWLDHALAASGVKKRQADGLAMGYARLSTGRTSVIVDASLPPKGRFSWAAHASTLAMELTSGRRPLIVNCGSGVSFGPEWRRAGRATPSHSTLTVDGYSSARLGDPDKKTGLEHLTGGPTHVPIEISQAPDGIRFQGGHDGYLKSHGLTHVRILELTFDGRGISGEDMLLAIDEPSKSRLEKAIVQARTGGINFDIRFHLHPEVDAALDLGGTAVSIALKSGEIWIFRHDGNQKLSLESSVYLETGRLKPRGALQIVLSGKAADYSTRVRWTLSKAQETAIGVRDLRRDEPAAP